MHPGRACTTARPSESLSVALSQACDLCPPESCIPDTVSGTGRLGYAARSVSGPRCGNRALRLPSVTAVLGYPSLPSARFRLSVSPAASHGLPAPGPPGLRGVSATPAGSHSPPYALSRSLRCLMGGRRVAALAGLPAGLRGRRPVLRAGRCIRLRSGPSFRAPTVAVLGSTPRRRPPLRLLDVLRASAPTPAARVPLSLWGPSLAAGPSGTLGASTGDYTRCPPGSQHNPTTFHVP